jgi:hypothetical protein
MTVWLEQLKERQQSLEMNKNVLIDTSKLRLQADATLNRIGDIIKQQKNLWIRSTVNKKY